VAQVGVDILAWLATLVSIALGALIALALTPPLSGPALEKIVAFRERDLAIPQRPPQSFWLEMWCGLKAQAFAAMLAIPCLTILWVVEVLLPAAAVVTVPLKLLVASLSMAWNLFDYPLTLRGVRMCDRFLLMSRYTRASLGFGAAFAALFFIPCFGILMLPAGVAASTDLVWRLLRSDPSLLPNLPRG
jgi:uncharacterized protein involved in cysteine biosynthesis